MTTERKGRDSSTRERILGAAGELFAEKGFARTTVRDICARAKVNLALVNYHFRSKERLYRAVWRRAVELAETLYPIDGGVPEKSSAEARLQGFIRAFLSRMTDRNRLGHFHGIRMMEFANPTGLSNEIFAGMVRKNRDHVIEILRSLLGPNADEKTLEMCHMSIISQCLMAHPKRRRSPVRPPLRFKAKDVDFLTEYITDFSLAGILKIKRKHARTGGSR
jgi:AcrR family transcriptional regulator